MRNLQSSEIEAVSGGTGDEPWYDGTQPWQQNSPHGLTNVMDPSDPAFIGIDTIIVGGTWTTDDDGNVTGSNVSIGFDTDGDGEADIVGTADTQGNGAAMTAIFDSGNSISLATDGDGGWTVSGTVRF